MSSGRGAAPGIAVLRQLVLLDDVVAALHAQAFAVWEGWAGAEPGSLLHVIALEEKRSGP